jgi:hypothetical protein
MGHGGLGGGYAGRGLGHGIGHSFGHFFGRRGRAPVRGMAFDRRRRFGRGRRFGFGGCTGFGYPGYDFFFNDDFNCFSDGFFFNPFFMGGYYGSYGGPGWQPNDDQGPYNGFDDYSGEPYTDDRPTQRPASDVISRWGGSTLGSINPSDTPAETVKKEQPVTLLQLRDGSMYGLVDYWVEAGELHYKTTYGGQDSIGLERIDLQKTVQLNGERGIQFVMRPRTAAQ